MKFNTRIFPILVPVLVISAAAFLIAADIHPGPGSLTVHEWGTLTSIAGDDGMAVDWQALDGPTDLPCFVHRLEYGAKANLGGTVRMETPVIYFYGSGAATVDVRVDFPRGFITEWYPKANRIATYFGAGIPPKGPDVRQPRGSEPDSIQWAQVKVEPRLEAPVFPFESAPSHYYAARSTDAVPILAGNEIEKFLFYRGVGRFQPPVTARVNALDEIVVDKLGANPLPAAILFENRDGAISYRVHGPIEGETIFAAPQTAAGTGTLRAEIERVLIAQGLFPKEATAMVATWGDSWFEEGTRVFYFLPTSAVDRILPMQIRPAPARVARVFVGRMEVFTPATKRALTAAITKGDWAPLKKYGRFLDPIASKLGPGPWTAQLNSRQAGYLLREVACGQGSR